MAPGLALLWAACGAPDRVARPVEQVEGIIDLLSSAASAAPETEIDWFTIHRDTRRAMILPGRVSTAIDVPPQAALAVAFGVDQESWALDAAPIEYQLVAEAEQRTVLWSGRVDPFHNRGDRRWHEREIPLEGWDGRAVRLTWSARGGRTADGRQARCGFAVPRIKAPAAAPRADSAGQRLPNLLLYVIDTLRADHLSGYGYPRPTSPQLDRFMRQGVTFSAVTSPSSWTKTSVASLLTSTYPFVHGANERDEVLTPLALTLPEWLRRYGYLCAGLVANSNVGAFYGFAQGFDSYRLVLDYEDETYESVAEVWPLLERWLRAHADERFFLYLHTVDPHVPYRPEEPYRSRFCRPDGLREFSVERMIAINEGRLAPSPEELEQLLDLYDAQINLTDDYFGRLDALLAELGIAPHTIVAVTSDHGEQFLEHGFITHGVDLFREEIQVPLMVRYPGRIEPGTRVAARTQLLDLMPTLLELAGVPIPARLDGRSMAALLQSSGAGAPEQNPTDVYAELRLDGRHARTLLRGRHKLMAYPDQAQTWLYDLLADPAEQHPIANGAVWSELNAAMQRLRRSRPRLDPEPQRRELDPEQLRLLKALGYAR